MPSSHLILCHPLPRLPPIHPSIRVFSNESTLCIRWPKYWSFSFNISPSNKHPGLISFRRDWWISLQTKGLSRVFSNNTVQKHQFFGVQLSSQPTSHIHTWPLEKPEPWLDRPLLAKQCLCFFFFFLFHFIFLFFIFFNFILFLNLKHCMLSRLVIPFLPRSKHLLISWLQSPSAVIWEPPP